VQVFIEYRESSIKYQILPATRNQKPETNPMVDILLIQPPIRDFYLTAKRTIPYGLACIASALMDSGFAVSILDGLATSKSRIRDLPEELSYLQPYYGRPDRSPFALFHHFRHYGYSFDTIGKKAGESGAFSGWGFFFIYALCRGSHPHG
jgi:hypothetical protein